MAKHISFPSIEQYRNVVKNVQERCRFHNAPLPTLTFHGTVKLHGTNSSVAVSPDGEVWAQSRSQVITPEADNAGFARFTESYKQEFIELARAVEWVTSSATIVIYGEWCGKGIQKGVAVTQLEKMFVIFAIRALEPEQEHGGWLSPAEVKQVFEKAIGSRLATVQLPIFCIENFPTWQVVIDMSFPQAQQNFLGELTLAVENECPVGKHFGVSGVGEGIVWRCVTGGLPYRTDDLTFKVKGEKHSDSKVKVLAAVDLEKVQNVMEFVEKVVTEHRLEKGIDHLKATANRTPFMLDVKHTGEFLKWIGTDVLKEEADLIVESGLDKKDVMPQVNKTARQWFMKRLNDEIMGRPAEEPGSPCIVNEVKA